MRIAPREGTSDGGKDLWWGLKAYARKEYETDITLEEAALYKRRFFETYPGLKAWHDRERRALERGGTETRTLTGRRRKGITKFTEWVNARAGHRRRRPQAIPGHPV